MNRPPLHHIVRTRTNDDLTFVSPGLMDEVMVNANQLENSVQATAASLWQTTLPFSVDPVLWRFQIPAWWRNSKGETKRNYRRLGAAYTRGTGIVLAEDAPLVDSVGTDDEWRTLAANIVGYQRNRLLSVPTQLDLLSEAGPRELHPVRVIAPALVAYSATEDRINRLLADAAAAVVDEPIAVQVNVPSDRLTDVDGLRSLLATIPTEGISAYFIWTPVITEERLLSDHDTLSALIRLTGMLAERSVPVGHQYANYTVCALHQIGLAAVIHHLGWVDKGEPAEDPGFMIRSCRSYVPGVRHSVPFRAAAAMGHELNEAAYVDRFCECGFCRGAFENGQHPLDLLLEDQELLLSDGRKRRTPTSRAVVANTWHYLWSRRLEIQAFSEQPATDVIRRDIERASELAGQPDRDRLQRLADELRPA